MRRSRETALPLSQRGVRCAVAAHASISLPAEALPALRHRPGPDPAPPTSVLKHADEQTVAGLVAVYRALHDHFLEPTALADWGVIAAPQLLGRTIMAPALQRFAEEGAWGISPHLIPHRSLHAVSGTISQALGLHGPNFGVGGGPEGLTEALLVAAALLADGSLPGLWVVLTAGMPDVRQEAAGLVWNALALGLTAMPTSDDLRASVREGGETERKKPVLCIGSGPVAEAQMDAPPLGSLCTTALLAAALAGKEEGSWHLGSAGWVSLHPAGPWSEDRS